MCQIHYKKWTCCVLKELIKKVPCELSQSNSPCSCTNDINLPTKDGLCPDCVADLKKGVEKPETKRCDGPQMGWPGSSMLDIGKVANERRERPAI